MSIAKIFRENFSNADPYLDPDCARRKNVEAMVAAFLEHDHDELAELLDGLNSGLHKQDRRQAFALLDLFWARLAVHIRAENLCLFPAILNASPEVFSKRGNAPSLEEARSIIKTLGADHNFFMDELAKCVKTFREIIDHDEQEHQVLEGFAAIQNRLNAVSLRLLSHNVLEEDQVYKWPAAILSALEVEELRRGLKRELENLPSRFGPP